MSKLIKFPEISYESTGEPVYDCQIIDFYEVKARRKKNDVSYDKSLLYEDMLADIFYNKGLSGV